MESQCFSVFQSREVLFLDDGLVVFLYSSFAGFVGRLSLLGVDVKAFYIPLCISFMRKDIGFLRSPSLY